MGLLQKTNEPAHKILWFFAALIIVKIVYSIAIDISEFHSWIQQGLLDLNSKSGLINSYIYHGVLGLIPYCFFGFIGAKYSRSFWLAGCLGVSVAAADIGSYLSFKGSTDGQAGLSMAIMYLGLLICSFFLFLFSNFILIRIQSKQNQI